MKYTINTYIEHVRELVDITNLPERCDPPLTRTQSFLISGTIFAYIGCSEEVIPLILALNRNS